MKREIKFRAWDNLTKSMYQVRDIDFLSNKEINSIRLVVAIQTSEDDIDFDFPIRRNGEYEIMQYTGLKDKNGIEIYEGDILKIDKGDPVTVSYENIYASFGIYRKGWAFLHYFHEAVEPEDCEVIGNIYDNPELLNN